MRSSPAAALVLVLAAAAAPAAAKVFASQQEALAQAFPDAERIERRSFVLTDAQAARVEAASGGPLGSRLVTLHTAWQGERALGYALIDVHEVRTRSEALLVVLSPAGEVASLRLLAFYEPQEYRPPAGWLERFVGRPPGGPDPGGAVQAIAGSTLTSHAVTAAVRRSQALFEVLVREAD